MEAFNEFIKLTRVKGNNLKANRRFRQNKTDRLITVYSILKKFWFDTDIQRLLLFKAIPIFELAMNSKMV